MSRWQRPRGEPGRRGEQRAGSARCGARSKLRGRLLGVGRAGPSERASARHLARTRRRATGPGGTEEGEPERGGCGTYFRSGGQIIPAKGEARLSGPLTVWGELVKKGGSGKGESCSFNSLPSSSSPSSRRRRRARGLEHTARAAPTPPPLRPRGAGPARAPRAPPRLRAAQALPVCGGAVGPGGGGGNRGGKKQRAEPSQVSGACTQGRGAGGGGRATEVSTWGGRARCVQAGGEDVKSACKRARGRWRNGAAGKRGGVRRGCNPGHPEPQASAPASADLPLWARARPIIAGGRAGGCGRRCPAPGNHASLLPKGQRLPGGWGN